ncbi:MAG: rhamnogalacturonan acetylesterase [Prevotella sp.]|nr:rhamnogalacturonan acetylesterase [Prevotella sp.]
MKIKKSLLAIFALMPLSTLAQQFDFDLTQSQPVYNDSIGYGYDILPAPDMRHPSTEPFYFSVKVPDGNYSVRVVLGGVKNGNTTVRAEGRRLMMDNILTPKKKDQVVVEFVVNKRSPQIDDNNRVRIKDRERGYLAWDNRLTLEFNGPQPAVRSIHIERNDSVPTIYLCGNSTVVDQNNEPWASWGQMITRWFGPQVAISNHAESGLTARTFRGANRLDKILSTLRPGDYVFVEFGHNDEKEHRPGDGAWYHYQYELKTFVDLVRGKGAEIVFCTPTQRRQFEADNRTIRNTHGDFPAAMKDVAQRENVPLIDLNQMTKVFFETLGFEDSKRALVHYPESMYGRPLADNTHFNPYGAYEVAKCVVMGMKQLNLPIVQYLRPEWQDFDPAQPDDWRTFQWAPARNIEIVTPDGN